MKQDSLHTEFHPHFLSTSQKGGASFLQPMHATLITDAVFCRTLIGIHPGLFLGIILPVIVTVIAVICYIAIRRFFSSNTLDLHLYMKEYVHELMGMTDDELYAAPTSQENDENLALVVTGTPIPFLQTIMHNDSFSDIEDSTAQSERSDQLFKELISTHNQVLSSLLSARAGMMH